MPKTSPFSCSHDGTPRRRLLASMCAAALVAAAAGAQAQSPDPWPAKQITWLVGWPPGGSADTVTRLVARKLETKLGQPVVIDNRPGASGSIALNAAAKAAPDGYTLVTIPGPVLMKIPVPHVPKELTGVAELAKGPMVLVGAAQGSQVNLKALVADMKTNPGAYSFASSGNGTSQHLGGELFNQLAGTRMTHIPYKGGNQAVTDVIGGQVPLGMLGITPVLPHIRSGKLKAYAVSTAQRSPALPDVPTMAEAGVSGFEASQWFLVAAPAGMPPARIQVVNSAIAEILAMPDIVAGFAAVGVAPSSASASDTNAFAAAEDKRWNELARKANLPLD